MTIGIIGGGQLGYMMYPAIKKHGFKMAVLDPAGDCPCSHVADYHVVAGFNDEAGFFELAKKCDVITYEFEHVNAEILAKLEDLGHKVYPSAKSLAVIQDKFTQKQALKAKGIPVPDFEEVESVEQLVEKFRKSGEPFMLKARRGGYDGYGNHVVKTENDIHIAWQKFSKLINSTGRVDLMAEPLVDFEKEVSVIATRGLDGVTVVYPISENSHTNSILDVTTVPAVISQKTFDLAQKTATEVLDCFGAVGTFCVEFFVLKDGSVSINEVAPRVHNSGHYTINACATSQFENHILAIAGKPLGKTDMLYPAAAMKNVLGEPGFEGRAKFTGVAEAEAIKGVSVHNYQKATTKPGRKMGHVNIVGDKDDVIRALGLVDVRSVSE